jgi:hypothetical protein
MNSNENELIIDGVKFNAKPARNICKGCHFLDETICPKKPSCIGYLREDKQNIIWVKE